MPDSRRDPPVVRVNRTGLPSQIAEYIRTNIIRAILKPGDRLPTEQELAAEHGVSRAVIREAVAKLRHEGLLVSRQGLGVFVRSPEEATSITLDGANLAEPEDFRQLYELRLILETGAADLAARNHTEDSLANIARTLEAMAEATELHEDYVQTDIGFHKAVAAASQNPFVSLFISFVDARLKESIHVALKRLDFERTRAISQTEHRAIFEAIQRRDGKTAAEAMRAHLVNSSHRLGL